MPLEEGGIQTVRIEPPTLIDQHSATNFYIGVSQNFKDPSKPYWQIKRIWQVGTVWYSGYPDGDQTFNFTWDQRLGYVYL